MIAPLPRFPIPPSSGEASGTHGDTPDAGGDPFAGILAATAARLPGPPPIPEHGPAVVRLPQAPAPGLTDPAPADLRAEPRDAGPAAEIFNQRGFFADGPSAEGSTSAPVPMPGAPARPLTVSADAAASATATAPSLRRADPRAAIAPAPSEAPRVPQSRTARIAISIASPFLAPVAARTEEMADPFEPLAPGPPVRERPAARTAVQVVLRELEQGLHVAARLDALGEGERERLHEEIAALLARHGLAPRHIAISAPVRASRERLK